MFHGKNEAVERFAAHGLLYPHAGTLLIFIAFEFEFDLRLDLHPELGLCLLFDMLFHLLLQAADVADVGPLFGKTFAFFNPLL